MIKKLDKIIKMHSFFNIFLSFDELQSSEMTVQNFCKVKMECDERKHGRRAKKEGAYTCESYQVNLCMYEND